MTDTQKRLDDEVGKAKGRSLWEDQKAWSEAHKHADELVYKNNAIYSAIYYPPIRFMGRATTVIATSILQCREDTLREYKDALIWCSGSEDFQVGGKAREGWEKICVPLLEIKKDI